MINLTTADITLKLQVIDYISTKHLIIIFLILTKQVHSSDSASDLYLGGSWFQSWAG